MNAQYCGGTFECELDTLGQRVTEHVKVRDVEFNRPVIVTDEIGCDFVLSDLLQEFSQVINDLFRIGFIVGDVNDLDTLDVQFP